MQVGLANKVVIVTGAASGIGAAIARLGAMAGAQALVLTDRDAAGLAQTATLAQAAGVQVATVIADLADPVAPGQIIAAARDGFGRIDGLVNAAGLTTRGSMLDGTPAIWDQLFSVNARAPYFMMQGTIADMRARGAQGSIVNIQSINVHCGAPDLAVYAASKGALQTLTRNAAHAHMADRIRVNGINLGWALTEGEQRMQAETLGLGPGWLAAAAARMPLGRLIEAEDCARLAVYLLSDASAPLSGSSTDLEQRVIGAP